MNNPLLFGNQMLMNEWNMQPSEVKGLWNTSTQYYKRYLYDKVFSVFDFTLPENWDLNYFRWNLFKLGSLAAIYTNEFGWIVHPYGIKKLNLYYNPYLIEVYSPFFAEPKEGIIGINSGIIKIFDDYYGIDDLVTRYAEMLAQCDKSVNVNLMNSNVTVMFKAENKKQADTIKLAYTEATEGKPFIAINKDAIGEEDITTFFPGVATNYIADKLLQTKRTIVNSFLTDIGIKNANYDKRERLNSQEVSENNDETKAIVSVMYNNIDSAFKKINKLSGLKLAIEYAYQYEEEVDADDYSLRVSTDKTDTTK